MMFHQLCDFLPKFRLQGIYDFNVWINPRHQKLFLACSINSSSDTFLYSFFALAGKEQNLHHDRDWRAKVKLMRKQLWQSLNGHVFTVLVCANKSQLNLIYFSYWKTRLWIANHVYSVQIRFGTTASPRNWPQISSCAGHGMLRIPTRGCSFWCATPETSLQRKTLQHYKMKLLTLITQEQLLITANTLERTLGKLEGSKSFCLGTGN